MQWLVPRKTIHRYLFSGVGGFMRVLKRLASIAMLPMEKFVDTRGQPFPKHREGWNKP